MKLNKDPRTRMSASSDWQNEQTDRCGTSTTLGVPDREPAEPASVLLVVRHPVGGIRTFLRYVFGRLPPQKYRLTLIAPQCPELDELRHDLAPYALSVISTNERADSVAFFSAVARSILRGHFDLVYAHGFTSGFASVLGSSVSRTPHMTTCHDVFTDDQFVGMTGLLKKLALAVSLAMTDRVHCVTSDARDNLIAYLPLTRLFQNKITVIRNGIEIDRFANPTLRDFRTELGLGSDSFLIGFLGRFMSQKGFRFLVDALALLQRQGTAGRRPVILTVSPQDGFYREEMAEIERRGLSASVFFLPFVANVAPTLRGLDVLAMPSLWEACGLLAMEAMVAGTPVVGTNCVGLREVLADTPAKVVPPKDAQALAQAIGDEMRSPTTQQAREFAAVARERFTVAKQAEGLDKLMDALVLGGRSRRTDYGTSSERRYREQ